MRGLLNLKGKGDFYLNIVMYRLSSILKINISESIFFYIAQPLSWTTCASAAVGWQTRQVKNLACHQSSRPLFVHTPVATSMFVPLPPFAQCQDRGRTSILLSRPRLTGATASGRVYRPILVQLNVWTPDSWPHLQGATGGSVHRPLMANQESDSGQLFPLKAARMPLAANNTGRQETCLTHTVLL